MIHEMTKKEDILRAEIDDLAAEVMAVGAEVVDL